MFSKIKTITYLKIIIIVLILLIICLLLNNNFINSQTKIDNYNRYILSYDFYKNELEETKLMITTNNQEYQSILKQYEIEVNSKEEKNFNQENYAFILLRNHYLCDSDILKSYNYKQSEITFNFERKYLCPTSVVGNIVYEIPVSKNINKNLSVKIKYMDKLNSFINTP